MASVRTRLTAAYSAALTGTLGIFTVALMYARTEGNLFELQRTLQEQASAAARAVRQSELSNQPVTVEGENPGTRTVNPALRVALEGVPGYLLVLDDAGKMLYSSFAVRQLGYEDRANLQSGALQTSAQRPAVKVTLGEDQILLVARDDKEPPPRGTRPMRVVAGASLRRIGAIPQEQWTIMLGIAPLLVLASVWMAWMIAGNALRPVDRVIDEVEAITDGRSLHRRLPVEARGDELDRLASTLNDMIARLETSFGALRRFTADASHELKTPLTVLRADVERAMQVASGSADQLVALEEALAETARMADLVDSLLTLARADEGRFDVHREPVALEPLVRDVAETAHILGESQGIVISLPVLEEATVMGDRARLRQLLLNLVTNAIKYTPAGGEVEISLARRLDGVSVSVRDTGIGISAADLPYVFERFWRADRARSRASERGGFGLGLSIARWIAQAHGGTLSVTSRLGRGSTFTVLLPVAADPPRPDGEGTTAADGEARASERTSIGVS
ncbi:MAG: HAMP domain-containing histidine kinase [Gemmatimonadetes bacterium]|nr:HAMP domain-containing histidine kinase [Gemmatimonadota bacterium]